MKAGLAARLFLLRLGPPRRILALAHIVCLTMPAETAAPSPTEHLEREAAAAAVSGDLDTAIDRLQSAAAIAPDNLPVRLHLAALLRRAGQPEKALRWVDEALALSPRDFAALLMRASLLERVGAAREAVLAYGVALAQAPDLSTLSAPAQRAALHGQTLYAKHKEDLAAALDSVEQQAALPDKARRRLKGFVDGLAGRTKRYRQEPSAFFYPGLPAISFYDREDFAWLPGLEAETDTIASELAAVLDGGQQGFQPYVDYADTLPLDQWRALNRSPDWSAFHLIFNGEPVTGNADRCPRTLSILRELPQPKLPGRSPAAMFSVLRPKTRIPPHTGVSNTRLVVHLPLIVPPGCHFTVGGETRTWERGRAWVFDDTIEHEAVNDSEQDRIILIFDIEQPAVSAAEHEAIAELARTLDSFGGATAFGPL